jgi:hypothetical protein
VFVVTADTGSISLVESEHRMDEPLHDGHDGVNAKAGKA